MTKTLDQIAQEDPKAALSMIAESLKTLRKATRFGGSFYNRYPIYDEENEYQGNDRYFSIIDETGTCKRHDAAFLINKLYEFFYCEL